MSKTVILGWFVLSALCGAQDWAMPFMAQKHPGRPGGLEKRDDARYESGQRALDAGRWDEALAQFSQVTNGARADGALYWKAYALNRLARRDEALAAVAELRKAHPNSRWLDDAKALELEVRQGAGQKINPENQADDDLKLMALNSLMHGDPERAVPLLEKILKGSATPKLKKRALFVLAQSDSARARELLAQVMRGAVNPDLQIDAINFMASMGGRNEDRIRMLEEAYQGSADARVKRAVIRQLGVARQSDRLVALARSEKDPDLRREIVRAFMISHDVDRLIEVARTEKDAAVRREAINLLGTMRDAKAGAFLSSMYQSESDPEVRKSVINSLFVQENAKALIEMARKETNPELKRAIVGRLSMMRSKEATDYMLEILNK